MMPFYAVGAFLLVLVGYAVLFRRLRRRAVGPAAVGMVYDLLNQDRRNAVEMIVEDKAEERDPERAAGKPGRRGWPKT